jgi:hypothetical protein
MAEATLGVAAGCAFALEQPAISSVVFGAKGVSIEDNTIIDELKFSSLARESELLTRNNDPAKIVFLFHRWEKGVENSICGRRNDINRSYVRSNMDNVLTWNDENIVGRRGSVIFSSESKCLSCCISEIVDISGDNSDIRSKLSFFSIFGSVPLSARIESSEAGSYGGYKQQPKIRISPVIFGCLGIGLLFIGLWHGFRARRRGPLFLLGCITIFITGWLMLAFCDVIAESAPVFCGSSGASAQTYSCAEDVRVITIVVTELEFRDVQRNPAYWRRWKCRLLPVALAGEAREAPSLCAME